MSEELKPCPFCGSENLKAYGYSQHEADHAYCYCEDCNTVGPSKSVLRKAIEAWNKRSILR